MTALRIERVDDHPVVSNITVNAWKGEHKVGSALICTSEDQDGVYSYSIEWVEVNPDHQQQGIATQIVEAIVGWLKGSVIEAVANPHLVRVFTKLKFVPGEQVQEGVVMKYTPHTLG